LISVAKEDSESRAGFGYLLKISSLSALPEETVKLLYQR
jgi:hypothetical protein